MLSRPNGRNAVNVRTFARKLDFFLTVQNVNHATLAGRCVTPLPDLIRECSRLSHGFPFFGVDAGEGFEPSAFEL